MVQVQDGSIVRALDLIDGYGEDPEGNKIKFERVDKGNIPAFKGEVELSDGRTRVYTFGLDDTNVVVHMTVSEPKQAQEKPEKPEKPAASEKVVKQVTPQIESKKNSNHHQKLSPPDFKVRKASPA